MSPGLRKYLSYHCNSGKRSQVIKCQKSLSLTHFFQPVGWDSEFDYLSSVSSMSDGGGRGEGELSAPSHAPTAIPCTLDPIRKARHSIAGDVE